MNVTPDHILGFWLDECSPDDWYVQDDALDAKIRDRFREAWENARNLLGWTTTARGALALLILTDQFPRNMFRGQGQAFSTDRFACAVAKRAIWQGMDLFVDGRGRQFFYLPLEHSESTQDQHRAVRLILTRLEGSETLLHARAHRAVIRRFGRFPPRNEALGRMSSPGEQAFLDRGGYGAVVRELRAA
ncbi:DUF924 family protein [Jannaschia rubra]|uniref:DUF924 domain-containing protein n=1 Tax=Jannaschia rubra TaxID=282197 RepID=A0A0M6XUM6_9RHOB|nr:DUF924 family protein [Jannaschia rubra]CTQ33943.1 hypothetical protein JAN5088_02732 [Jannaschia rubra]SFG76669.1 Uncharacterized conserved protein, DUF924 family [Jannaschia rubra]